MALSTGYKTKLYNHLSTNVFTLKGYHEDFFYINITDLHVEVNTDENMNTNLELTLVTLNFLSRKRDRKGGCYI